MKEKCLELLRKAKDFVLTHSYEVTLSTMGLAAFVLCCIMFSQFFFLDTTTPNRLDGIRYSSEKNSTVTQTASATIPAEVLAKKKSTSMEAPAQIPDFQTPATNLPGNTISKESIESSNELESNEIHDPAEESIYIETCIGDATRIVLDAAKNSVKEDITIKESESEESKEEESITDEITIEETEETFGNPIGSFRVKNDVHLLNMRETPDNDAKIVAKLTNISRGSVLGYDEIWAHVKTTNYEGYVATKYILITED